MRKFSLKNFGLLFFIVLILSRFITMWWMPLMDTTEARYGEIARKMVETGDWITLWHDYGVPFWAKPPLSTWLSAFSMNMFGINEFTTRLPSFLLASAVVILIWHFSHLFLKKSSRLLSVVILSSMALFYLAAGMVMTDMSLLFSTTLVLVSFWFAVEESNRKWGYIFFIALGIGMLAKGPAAIVLSLLPIFFWLLWTNSWGKMWRALPWLGGIPLMLAIFLPWYVIAEIKTPGFLHYFIIGEHIDRFLTPAWHGDLYGHAHREALGTIWLYLCIGALPWIAIVIPRFIYRKLKFPIRPNKLTAIQKYLWCSFLSPLVFFTFAHNIILSYPLTALPALAILIAQSLSPIAITDHTIKKWVYGVGLFTPIILMIATISVSINPELGKKSAKQVSLVFQNLNTNHSQHLGYADKRLYSMEFYNAGKVTHFKSVSEALNALKKDSSLAIALTNRQVKSLSKQQQQQLKLESATKWYKIYHEK